MGWATFWATFSQTRLVTLSGSETPRWAGLPDFSSSKHTKMGEIYKTTTNYTKMP
jgi:hypothetical protein